MVHSPCGTFESYSQSANARPRARSGRHNAVSAVPVLTQFRKCPRLPGDALSIDSRKNLVLLLRRALQYLRVDFLLLLGGRSTNELRERRRRNLRRSTLESKKRHNYSPRLSCQEQPTIMFGPRNSTHRDRRQLNDFDPPWRLGQHLWSLRSRARGGRVKGRSRRVRHCVRNLALGTAPGSTNVLTRLALVELGCHAQDRRRRPTLPSHRRDPSRPRLQPVSAQDRHRYPACPRLAHASHREWHTPAANRPEAARETCVQRSLCLDPRTS